MSSASSSSAAHEDDRRRMGIDFRIGCALSPKKQQSLLQPSLLEQAKCLGIHLLGIDIHQPLANQGPFHAILHKLSAVDWYQQLSEYTLKYPDVIVVDPPCAIARLRNRISMLQAVSELQVSGNHDLLVGTPRQCVLDGTIDWVAVASLKFPVITKPLVADGSATSHAMSLVFNVDSIAKLNPPLVLQEFVNHGGVLFKVYVVGDFVRCVRRRSLPDVLKNEIGNLEDPLPFSQISNMPTSTLLDAADDQDLLRIDLPDSNFISAIASGLRKLLGLRLFNFDVIRDTNVGNHYYVIDINYFPGYEKMPNYEIVLTDFFLSLAQEKISAEGHQPEGR